MSRSKQTTMLHDYGKYKDRLKQPLRTLMSTLKHIEVIDIQHKIKIIDDILIGFKRDLDEFWGSHPEYAPMETMVKNLKRKIIKYSQRDEVFAYSDADVIVFNHVDKSFLTIFNVALNLPKRLVYDLDPQLKWNVDYIFGYLISDSVEDGTKGIDQILDGLNRMFDDIAFGDRDGIPARVLKNKMISKFRNLIFIQAKSQRIYAYTDTEEALFDYLNTAFKKQFGFELDLPKQMLSRERDRPHMEGPSDKSLEPVNQGKGPRGTREMFHQCHNTEGCLNSTCAILDNLHQRLSALELQMGL